MTQLFELFGLVRIDTGNAERNLRDIEGSAERAGNSISDVGSKISNLGSTISNVGSSISGFGAKLTAGVTLPLVGAITGAVNGSAEWRQEIAKLDTAIGASLISADSGRRSFDRLYAAIGDEGVAVEAVQQLSAIVDTEKELKDLTTSLIGVYGAFGGALPVEGLAEAVSVSATLGKVTGPLVDAFEFVGGAVEDEDEALAKLNNSRERTAYLTERLLGIYGEEAKSYLENNDALISQREAQIGFNDALAELGETLTPIIVKFTEVITGLIEKFNGLSDEQQQNIIKFAIFAGAAGPIITILGFITGGVGKLIFALGGLTKTIGLVVNAVKILILLMQGSFALLFSPAGLIIVGIGLLVAALYLLITNFDKVKAVGKALVDGLTSGFTFLVDTVTGAIDSFVGLITGPIDYIKEKYEDFKNFFKNLFDFDINLPEIVGNIPVVGGIFKGAKAIGQKFFAKGGVMEKPTEFARSASTSFVGGEAGREAIVPLEGTHMVPMATKVADILEQRNAGNQGNVPEQPFVINIQNMNVRKEQDIQLIAEELEKLNVRKRRVGGRE